MDAVEEERAEIDALRARGRDLEARRLLSDYLMERPTDPWGFVTLGRTHLERRDFPQAQTLFERARALAPNSYLVNMALADMAFARNKTEDGLECLERAAQAEDADWEVVDRRRQEAQLAVIRRELTRAQQTSNSAKMLEVYERWLNVAPDSKEARAGYGTVLFGLGEDDDALEQLLLSVDPTTTGETWRMLGRLRERRGEVRLAGDAFQVAIDRGLPQKDEDEVRTELAELALRWGDAADRLIAVLRDDEREYWTDTDGQIAAALTALLPVEPHEWRRVGTEVGSWVNTTPGRVWPWIKTMDPKPSPATPRIHVTTDKYEWVIARLEDRSLALHREQQKMDPPYGIQKVVLEAVGYAHRSGFWERCLAWADLADVLAPPRTRVQAFRADALAEQGDAEAAAAVYQKLRPNQVPGESAIRAARVYAALDDENQVIRWLTGVLEANPERRVALETDTTLRPFVAKLPADL